MDNDKQQDSQFSPQWIYDQEHSLGSPDGPLHAHNYPLLPDNNYPPLPDNNGQFSPLLSPSSYDPDLTMDMGNSLGYSQAMEFHAGSMPQPTRSQPRIRAHEKRFQELRRKRMTRDLQHNRPGPFTRKQRGSLFGKRKPAINEFGHDEVINDEVINDEVINDGLINDGVINDGLINDGLINHGVINDGLINGAPTELPRDPSSGGAGVALAVAAEPAQDTGMIQRVKVARAAFLITGAFMLTSVLGLVRTFLFPYVFTIGHSSDVYVQAYIIPNLLYTVVAGGALSSAFIPVFIKYSDALKDEKSAWHITSSALNLCLVIMITLAAIAMLLAPVLVPLYSSSFTPAELALTVTLTRIMLLQAIVLGLGVIVSAVLNAKQDFTLTAIGAILYNVGQVLGFLPGIYLHTHAQGSTPGDLAIYAATWGVVLAAILQVSVQIPGLFKVKMRYTFSFDWRHPGVRQIGRQMVPRAINAAMLSFSTAVDRELLSFLGAAANDGLITEYLQAFTILVLPITIFGSSISTAAFPALSSYVARERLDRVRSIIMETLRSILFLSIPSCIGLIILAFPIIQVLLEHGSFTQPKALSTAIPLIFFAPGLPALASVEILTRAFYALRDSKTPVVISVTQFILKIALAIVLIDFAVFGVQWGMAALAFSTAVASTLEAVVLFIILHRRIGGFDLRALTGFLRRTLVAALGMGVVLFVVREGLDGVILTTSSDPKFTLSLSGIFLALIKLLIELGIGSLAFLSAAKRLKIEEIESGPVRKILNRLHISWL